MRQLLMEDKEAITHLAKIIEKYPLTEEEKEAAKTAIGVLSWTSLRSAALKRIAQKKRERRGL